MTAKRNQREPRICPQEEVARHQLVHSEASENSNSQYSANNADNNLQPPTFYSPRSTFRSPSPNTFRYLPCLAACQHPRPMQPTGKRTAGILLPAFSPRRPGDLGIGDTLALRQWIDWAADHHVGFLQLLPINETGADDSPYNAISSVAIDPVYLAFDEGQIPFITPSDLNAAHRLLGAALTDRLVEYRTVRATKRQLLDLSWSRFTNAPQHLKDEFATFRREEAAWLNDYCLYRWLMERNNGAETWDLWPDDCNTPQAAHALYQSEHQAHPELAETALGHFAYIQWLCFRQWRAVRAHADARGVKLMGDIPIGISWYSSDVFFGQENFDLDWCGGAPPETMFKHDRFIQQWGQNWGIPLYRWDKMQAEGFPWWRQRIEKLTEIFHIFRIDHILGFYRIYAFPWRPQRNHEFLDRSDLEAAKLSGGKLPQWAWRPDDTEENKLANRIDGDVRLRAIIDAARGGEVVGEDLGCVPDYVRPHLSSLGIAGFRIPHWDTDEDGHVIPPSGLPECSFATYATHDHDTIAAMWDDFIKEANNENCEEARTNLRLLSEFCGIPIPANGIWPAYSETIQWRLTKALFDSKARYAALMVTDLFGMTDRYNQPGTVGGENWRLRLPWTIEEIQTQKPLKEASDKLAMLVGITRRA